MFSLSTGTGNSNTNAGFGFFTCAIRVHRSEPLTTLARSLSGKISVWESSQRVAWKPNFAFHIVRSDFSLFLHLILQPLVKQDVFKRHFLSLCVMILGGSCSVKSFMCAKGFGQSNKNSWFESNIVLVSRQLFYFQKSYVLSERPIWNKVKNTKIK